MPDLLTEQSEHHGRMPRRGRQWRPLGARSNPQRVGRLLGDLLFLVDVPHRRIVRRNLHFVYPNWSWRRIRRVSQEIFRHFGITLVEIVQLFFLSREEILQRVTIAGEENLQRMLESPTGAIAITAHIGNWEMGSIFVTCYGKPVTAVARRIENRILDRLMLRLRTRFGNAVIEKQGAFPAMTRVLRRGGILGLLIDQGTKRSEGVKVRFFNAPVTATPAAALAALRCRTPVFPLFCLRRPDGRLQLVAEAPMALQRTGNLRHDMLENTQRMMDVLERTVRRHPEQWFWFHKRWKKFHPQLYPEYQARKRRSRARRRALRQIRER